MPVKVVSYNPLWEQWFDRLSKPFSEKLRNYNVEIVHVGSTSIKGMSAKPIIDIDITIDNWHNFPEIKQRLYELGYEHQGDLGIKEREAFKLNCEPKYPHNLYVCHKNSLAFKNHILLKKHLSENTDAFKRYEDLKINLGNTTSNVDEYARAQNLS
jgi:GrpB-like predicted nucleotidyltransferase (UPF0157 family)